MAKNEPLENTVLTELFKYASNGDPVLKAVADDSEEISREVVKMNATTRVDKDYKFSVVFSHFIGYGYDLTKKDSRGNSAKEIYERAVKNTKELGGHPNMESLVADGVEGDFGWYITRLN